MLKVIFPAVLVALCFVGLAGTVGRPREVDKNDRGAQSALNFAVAEHNRHSNDMYLLKPAEVLSVTKQVDNGYLYTITVKMGKTSCRKDGASEMCAIHEDPAMIQPYQCVFTVWSRPWEKSTTLKGQTCSEMEWKIILFVLPALFALTCGNIGGSKGINIQDSREAQEALKKAVEEHNKHRNCEYLTKVKEVKEVEEQVVQGKRYKMTVIMAKTPCKKDQILERCSVIEDPEMAQPYECTFTVWNRPWLPNPTIFSEECS